MRTIDIKKIVRRKISTGITGTNTNLRLPVDEQIKAISQWSDTIPSMMVLGAHEPISNPGVRWIKSANPNPPIKNLLSAYLTPGNEVCILAAPTILLGGNQDGLMEFMARERMELSWMAFGFAKTTSNEPDFFVMSKSVVAHLSMALPPTVTFAGEWAKFIHEWGKKFMPRHRYFDATQYGVGIPLPTKELEVTLETVFAPLPAKSEVLNAYAEAEAEITPKEPETPVVKKRGRPPKKS